MKVWKLDWENRPRRRPDDNTPDNFTRVHAEKLVSKIRIYWAARGLYPDVWIETQVGQRDGRPIFNIRSNMVGGMPEGSRGSL